MYLVQWSEGRAVLMTWVDVTEHPMFESSTVFERIRFGGCFGWVAC